MPRFEPNPSTATAGFPIYPEGEYEVVIGEPVSFLSPGKDGKQDNYGVRFKSTIGEGDKKGKQIMINCYQHTEESCNFAKQVQMAALGYKKNDEDKFNAEQGSADWSFNTDDKSAGEAWHKMQGQRVMVMLAVKMGQNGEEQQQIKSFRPLN